MSFIYIPKVAAQEESDKSQGIRFNLFNPNTLKIEFGGKSFSRQEAKKNNASKRTLRCRTTADKSSN